MTHMPAHRRAEQPPVPAQRTNTPASEPPAEPASGGEAEKHGRRAAAQPKEA